MIRLLVSKSLDNLLCLLLGNATYNLAYHIRYISSM